METTNLRAHGSREYWDSVALYARLNRTSTAALIKMAMDHTFGQALDSLAPLLAPSDFAERQNSKIEDGIDHA